jgi:transcriptional regulator with XRE-family HTH domain
MKEGNLEVFGPRLAKFRMGRGITLTELGDQVGVSYRMIAHYERPDAQPPGPILPNFAGALGVSTGELLGVEPLRDTPRPKSLR